MTHPKVGVVHPGAMGVTVAAAAAVCGAQISWASSGRSAATRRRAADAGLTDVEQIATLAADCEILISVCPPAAAVAQAAEIAACGFTGVYVDANAIAPGTAHEVMRQVVSGGAEFVDGGIIGPPAHRAGTTRLYLSGPGAGVVAELFTGSPLEPLVIDDLPGSASALKMAYAGYTKGTTALLLAIRGLARAQGEQVDAALMREWELSQPGLVQRSEDAAANNAHKAWRFAAEMREIAASFEAAGLPPGFHQAAAQLFDRLAGFKASQDPATVSAVVDELLRSPPVVDV